MSKRKKLSWHLSEQQSFEKIEKENLICLFLKKHRTYDLVNAVFDALKAISFTTNFSSKIDAFTLRKDLS